MIPKIAINNISSAKQAFKGSNKPKNANLDYDSPVVQEAMLDYSRHFFALRESSYKDDWQKLTDMQKKDFIDSIRLITRENSKDNSFICKAKFHQCGTGYYAIAEKSMPTDESSLIDLNIRFNQDMVPIISRTEELGDMAISWVKNSNRSYILEQDYYFDIKDYRVENQFEIICDEFSEPSQIIHFKPSTILDGVFDITKYELKNYDEDVDVIKEIKNGTLQGGETIARVSLKPDGVVEYNEAFELNGVKSVRKYSHKINPKGGIFYSEYQYKIFDENNQIILDIDRSFANNPDGSTTTRVGDKIYTTTYDKDNLVFQIVDNDGVVHFFDLKKFTPENEDYFKVYELCRKCPADLLIQILNTGKLDGISICRNSLDSKISSRIKYHITTGNDMFQPFAHEVGHLIDAANLRKYRLNQKIIDTYKEECENFAKDKPANITKFAQYFSLTSSATELPVYTAHLATRGKTGLGELFAEVNILTKTYGAVFPLGNRDMYLVRYFPKTIALIAKELGY